MQTMLVMLVLAFYAWVVLDTSIWRLVWNAKADKLLLGSKIMRTVCQNENYDLQKCNTLSGSISFAVCSYRMFFQYHDFGHYFAKFEKIQTLSEILKNFVFYRLRKN